MFAQNFNRSKSLPPIEIISKLPEAESVSETVVETIRNPILANGADPYIVYHQGLYYYIQGKNNQNGAITIKSAQNLSGLKTAKEHIIWKPITGDHTKELWAPELHFINNRWYVYFAASDGNNINHKMYVLESSSEDIHSEFHEIGRICAEGDNCWGIDMTVFEHTDGCYYAIWSGWPTPDCGFPQNLYIAKMKNPWTLDGPRVCISKPELEWEINEGRVNEGPQILKKNGKVYIIYSASGSWTHHYCLGQLSLIPNSEILNPNNWIKKLEPVFQTGQTKIWGPGHTSFLKLIDGREMMFYHAKKSTRHNWSREIRAKEFTWNNDDTPNFGKPV